MHSIGSCASAASPRCMRACTTNPQASLWLVCITDTLALHAKAHPDTRHSRQGSAPPCLSSLAGKPQAPGVTPAVFRPARPHSDRSTQPATQNFHGGPGGLGEATRPLHVSLGLPQRSLQAFSRGESGKTQMPIMGKPTRQASLKPVPIAGKCPAWSPLAHARGAQDRDCTARKPHGSRSGNQVLPGVPSPLRGAHKPGTAPKPQHHHAARIRTPGAIPLTAPAP